MKVLVIGSGGREHALAWKIRKSQHVSWIGVAPGNGGTTSVAENVPLDISDLDGVENYVREQKINVVVIGPEAPLVAGLADRLAPHTLVFGPSASAAKLEGDKRFSKDLMNLAGIPSAPFMSFNDQRTAMAHVRQREAPMVVKASGLAAGKGVFICDSRQEAEKAVRVIMEENKFGDAGQEVIVEDCLQGQEISLQVLTDGVDYLVLPPVQDHKRIGEGDTGPNTGGMGAYAPAEWVNDDLLTQCCREIIEPTLLTMREMGTPYRGLLYAGLMITRDGPKVLEFNCRFGDPETQAVLPLLGVDLLDLILAAVSGKLGMMMQALGLKPTDWRAISRKAHVGTIILASKGYPGSYEKGKVITGIPSEKNELVVFHAGTSRSGDSLVTSGGRVLAISALGDTLQEAMFAAYTAAEQIHFEGKYFRKDIGYQVLQK